MLNHLFPSNQIHITFKPIIKLPKKFTLEKDSFMPFDQNYSYPSNHLASTTAFSFIIGGIVYKRYPTLCQRFFYIFSHFNRNYKTISFATIFF